MNLLDTYQDFLAYWIRARFKSVEEQIRLWQTSYMKKHPELLHKQIKSYKSENIDWQEIAKKIFPTLPKRLQYMQKARDNILTFHKSICTNASERLGIDFEILLVVYVGIGCGAGWAAKYCGQPAVLLGLENIAEEKWHTKNKLQGLISHEIGHLAHMKWRNEWETFEKAEQDPLFLLYSEGFAQRCEHLILGKETWHFAQGKDYLSWCQQNKGWLAKEFLGRLDKGASVNDFFGSWFSIQGRKQTGYFLGHALICELERVRSLREIAFLKVEDVRKLAIRYLKSTVLDE